MYSTGTAPSTHNVLDPFIFYFFHKVLFIFINIKNYEIHKTFAIVIYHHTFSNSQTATTNLTQIWFNGSIERRLRPFSTAPELTHIIFLKVGELRVPPTVSQQTPPASRGRNNSA